MESVNNLASAASRYIWGEETKTSENETRGTEPLSGVVGNTAKGEPYDKGNAGAETTSIEPTSTSTTEPYSTPTTKPTSTSTGIESPSRTGATETGTTPATGRIRPEHDTDKTGVTSVHKPTSATLTEPHSTPTTYSYSNLTTEPTSTSTGIESLSRTGAIGTGTTPATGPIRPEHDTDKTGVTSVHNPTSATSSDKPTSSNDTSASVGAAPESGSAVQQKQQGADRPLEEPGSEASDGIKASKKEAEGVAAAGGSDLGPVPLRQKAKADGGGASAGGEDDGPQKKSLGEGTGEQYVMTSGMKADGGDFDASKPGAGREADRLLESKGVTHDAPANATERSSTPDSKDTKSSKHILKEKIKDKLHIHKN